MKTPFSLDQYPIAFLRPRVSFPYAWVGHIPFAYVLMDMLRPSSFVELGTDSGNSYLAFCQAVAHLGLQTHCTAVDSWEGDEHARVYDDSVYANLRAYHDPLYSKFSVLKRAYFDDALSSFADGSIDLLHIDGLHTYEAVKHDFESWLPKLSSRAVVLFHDCAVSERGFGVCRFLDELEPHYRIFRFLHSNGLGVLQIGASTPAVDAFMELARHAPGQVRAYFEGIAGTLLDARTDAPIDGIGVPDEVQCKIFYRMRGEDHDEQRSLSRMLPVAATGQRLNTTFWLRNGLRPDFLRIDPADAPGVFGMASIEMRCGDARVIFEFGRERISAFNGDLLPPISGCSIRMASFHDDPWFEIDVGSAMAALPVADDIELTLYLVYESVLHSPAMRILASEEGRLLDDIRGERITHDSFMALHGHFEHLHKKNQEAISKLSALVEELGKNFTKMDERQELQFAALEAQQMGFEARHEAQLAALENRQHSLLVGLETRLHADLVDTRQTSDDAVSFLRHDLDGIRCNVEKTANAVQEITELMQRGGLVNRLRRWVLKQRNRLKETTFGLDNLVPANLIPLDGQDGTSGWASLGGDPQFLIQPMTVDGSFAGGWYLFDARIEVLDGNILSPCLYPDYGYGAVEAERIDLPAPDAGGRLQMVVCLRQQAATVRFDPSIVALKLRMDRFSFKRIGRFAALSLMANILAEYSGDSDKAALFRKDTWRTALRSGLRAAGDRAFNHYREQMHVNGGSYADWISRFETPKVPQKKINDGPLVSIIVPAYNTPAQWLDRCINSVLAQTYGNWELCIVDDASPSPHVWETLQAYQRKDSRIKVARRETNGHISEASNSALALASGEWIGLLDHDDELAPHALEVMLEALANQPEWRIAYSDEDKINERGERFDPYFKPDFNYELLLGQNFICHFCLYEAELIHAVGGFREGLEGSQDWDLILRCVERIDYSQVGHVPKVLYHWRAISGSTAAGIDEKDYAALAGQRAIQEHLDRTRQDAQAQGIGGGRIRVIRALPLHAQRVSLIIPTRDKLEILRPCVQSILQKTAYPNYEVLIVDNQSSNPETLAYFAELAQDARVRVLSYDAPFNYSAINNFAARIANGDIIGLINNDIEVINEDWLSIMVAEAQRPEVGAVGAMLLYPDDTIQHAGVMLGLQGVAAHVYCGQPRSITGHMGRAQLVQAMSAVTAACLLVRKSVFEQVGGLDEQLKVAFNDVDFCLRVREAGYRNVWTPFAVLYHHESASRGYEDTPEKRKRFEGEIKFMFDRWGNLLQADPAYNPNLTLTGEPFALAFPPRTHWGENDRAQK